jgi:peroxiredoxin
MAESPTSTAGTDTRNRLLRYGITALILLVIGGLFVQREILTDESESAVIEDTVVELGLLDDRSVKLGQPAPDFALLDRSGNVVRLSDFLGKTVVLNFWASWCPPCRAEMPDFLEVYEQRLPQDDFVILAVDKLVEDTKGAVDGFVQEFGLTFPIAFDASDEVFQRYGVRGLPSTFFIDRNGVLRSKNLGPIFGGLLPDGIALADAAGEEAPASAAR